MQGAHPYHHAPKSFGMTPRFGDLRHFMFDISRMQAAQSAHIAVADRQPPAEARFRILSFGLKIAARQHYTFKKQFLLYAIWWDLFQ